MSESSDHNSEFREHRMVVDQIADVVGPRKLTDVSDAELEAMLDVHADAAYSPEQTERLAARFWTELHESSSSSKSQPIDEDSAAPLPPSSPVLGFLGNLTHLGGGYTPTLWTILALLTCTLSLVLVCVIAIRGIHVHGDDPGVAGGTPGAPHCGTRVGEQGAEFDSSPHAPSPQIAALPASSFPVARLTQLANCHWVGSSKIPGAGDELAAGRVLQLAEGVAEIEFAIGAKVILQSPVSFQLISANTAKLEVGKATVEIENERARGFKILTPEATFVDRGTEFGVEVAPGGSSKVHVFRGIVDVHQLAWGDRDAPPTQRLVENVGARMESGVEGLTLVQDTGECFIRSMDDADRDCHTIAYWRFEDRPLGTALPHTDANRNPVRATADSTFHGNDLFTFNPSVQPKFSGDVATDAVPQTGAANRGCLDTTCGVSRSFHPDLYTKSRFSHAAPVDIQTITPTQWTVEVSVKAKSLSGAVQTFIGRDGCDRPSSKGGGWIAPRLAFRITKSNRFAIRFADCDNRFHEAIAEQLPLEMGRWYNLAATSDGRTLRLFVDLRDGQGYRLQAQTALPKTGSLALDRGTGDAEWSIARGRNPVNGTPGEFFEGWIDEVRISDMALEPAQFLFAAPATNLKSTETAGLEANRLARTTNPPPAQ